MQTQRYHFAKSQMNMQNKSCMKGFLKIKIKGYEFSLNTSFAFSSFKSFIFKLAPMTGTKFFNF